MGCDIFLHIEVKIDSVWHHYGKLDTQRNYDLFAKMAGERWIGDFEVIPISEPKGLPDDVSKVTLAEYTEEKNDYYDVSWLSFEEIKTLYHWCLETEIEFPFSEVEPLYIDEDDFTIESSPYDDLRFVFWFSN
jgi:hypothetical protein